MTRLLLIDNYDSFTFNLVHLIGGLDAEIAIDVVRNDAIDVAGIVAADPDAVILSPGPCTPKEAGVCLPLIAALGSRTPIFGVCLGLQAIGQALGGRIVRAPTPMHGKVATISPSCGGLMRGINGLFQATRYHSLVIDADTAPAALEIVARSADGLIMAASHKTWPIHGVQFHPESVASEHGATILRNFLDLASAWNKTTARRA